MIDQASISQANVARHARHQAVAAYADDCRAEAEAARAALAAALALER